MLLTRPLEPNDTFASKCWGKAKLFDNECKYEQLDLALVSYIGPTPLMLYTSNSYNMEISTSKLSFILSIHNTSHNLHNVTKQNRLEHLTRTCISKTPWKSTTCFYCTILLHPLIVGNIQLF